MPVRGLKPQSDVEMTNMMYYQDDILHFFEFWKELVVKSARTIIDQ